MARSAHMTRVFESLRCAPTTVRSVVAETGLSRPTVMSLLAKLEKKGLASCNDAETVTAGRPASTWRVADDAGVVVGVDLLPESALISTARLGGEVIGAQLVNNIPIEGRRRLSALIGLIRSHQETLPRGAGPVRAITVSTTGPVDGAGTIINSVAVRDWSGFPLGRMLSERLGLPVRVENDINASAYGEFAARCGDGVLSNDADLLFVALSRGVLSGLVLRGQLHRGRGFTAGEVGIVVTGGSGPERGHLARAAEVIGSAAAVLDPTVIVLSLPVTEFPRGDRGDQRAPLPDAYRRSHPADLRGSSSGAKRRHRGGPGARVRRCAGAAARASRNHHSQSIGHRAHP